MYEGGILVPACVEWPGTIAAGKETNARCSTVDFFPTIASVVDYSFSKSKKRPIDGIDLLPIINGKVTQREGPLFFGYRRLYQGVDGQALISGDYKILKEAKKDGRTRLYNLATDPYEKNDLSKEHPKLLKELSTFSPQPDEKTFYSSST